MISDAELYRLAIWLGTISMLLIVLYHFIEANSGPKLAVEEKAK